jgi:hypothetical protein
MAIPAAPAMRSGLRQPGKRPWHTGETGQRENEGQRHGVKPGNIAGAIANEAELDAQLQMGPDRTEIASMMPQHSSTAGN